MSRVQISEYGGGDTGHEYKAHFSQAARPAGWSSTGYGPFARQASQQACCGQNVGGIERAASAAVGLGMTLAGIRRGKLPGLALTALGAGLLYRGITGRCQMYAALG